MDHQRQPYLVERKPGYFEYQLPISIKVVVDLHGALPLLKNERDEWELPGGKLELGEGPESTALREVEEELGLTADCLLRLEIISSWVYQIFPNRHVFVVCYGTRYEGSQRPRISHEHRDLRLFDYEQVRDIRMPQPYKKAIQSWREAHAG